MLHRLHATDSSDSPLVRHLLTTYLHTFGNYKIAWKKSLILASVDILFLTRWYNSRSSEWAWSATDPQHTHHKDAGSQKTRVRLRPQNVGEGNEELQRSRDRRVGTSGHVNRHEQTHQGARNQNIYRPPMKEAARWCFQSCQSVQEGFPCDHYPWCIETHLQAPRTFSNLFNLHLTWSTPRPDMLDVRTVSKRAVGILLECFLVIIVLSKMYRVSMTFIWILKHRLHVPSMSPFLLHFQNWFSAVPMVLFTCDVKKIKGDARKNCDVDDTCKRAFTCKSTWTDSNFLMTLVYSIILLLW